MKLLLHITKYRTILMGCSMIMILLYHGFCNIFNPFGNFNIGYVGVDIFLFLSGFGLAYSFESNSIVTFYKNRIKKIYPIYFVAVLCTYIIFNLNVWKSTDVLYNLLSIGYYKNGGINRYDWYLESLFSLYILFPLFYGFAKLKHIGFLFFSAIICCILYKYHVSWWYECLIGRLPIFLYGIIFKHSQKYFVHIGIAGLILYLPCKMFVSQFYASSLLVPAIITIIIKTIDILKINQIKYINYIGNHTIEIYISNVFFCWIFDSNNYNSVKKLLLYLFLQPFIILFVIIINKYINKLINFFCKIE